MLRAIRSATLRVVRSELRGSEDRVRLKRRSKAGTLAKAFGTLGGYITEYFNWRWAFYLNVPVCLLAFVMITLMVPRQGQQTRKPFNYYGFIMLGIAVACAQFILDRGERLDWYSSPAIILLTLIGSAALWVFVVNSMTSSIPLVDPALFRDKNYMSGIVLRVLFGVFLFGSLVLVPPFLQNQGGYPLVDSGVVMAWRGFAGRPEGHRLSASLCAE